MDSQNFRSRVLDGQQTLLIAGQTVTGYFVERPNRFLAKVLVRGKIQPSFLPNPGRLQELLSEGAKVLLREKLSPERKTSYDLIGIYQGRNIVSVDARVPNLLLREALGKRRLREFAQYSIVKPEFKFGKSQFDFYLANKNEKCIMEAKSCTLVRNYVAMFPDAPTERGTRHVMELIKAKRSEYRTCVLFIIQRTNARVFRPNEETDPKFAKALRQAGKNGVKILAYSSSFDGREVELMGRVPV